MSNQPVVKPFEALKSKTGNAWENISIARDESRRNLQRLRDIEFFPETESEGTDLNIQIVAFGSLARGEMTPESDLDWTLLLDGPANPEHLKLARRVQYLLVENGFQEPSPSGAFGSMASSHELIHQIGGARDSNENLTRRMLLLLEAMAIPNPSNRIVLSRVLRQVLSRYIDCDPSVSRLSTNKPIVPRFLLNDLVRYWRTIAVDYAAKKWEQEGKWALRNSKLRMSRKLIFAKGLLMCLNCERLPEQKDRKATDAAVVEYCEKTAGLSAIDVLSQYLLEGQLFELSKVLLDSYDGFLGIISDDQQRKQLKVLRFEDANNDSVFQSVREIGKRFQQGLAALFFDEQNGLADLTKEYGLF